MLNSFQFHVMFALLEIMCIVYNYLKSVKMLYNGSLYHLILCMDDMNSANQFKKFGT